jgi:hypothetical protein
VQELLEGIQCSSVAHFEFEGVDEGTAVDGLRGPSGWDPRDHISMRHISLIPIDLSLRFEPSILRIRSVGG